MLVNRPPIVLYFRRCHPTIIISINDQVNPWVKVKKMQHATCNMQYAKPYTPMTYNHGRYEPNDPKSILKGEERGWTYNIYL